MRTLNFPPIKAKIQKGLDGKFSIYDIIRKKYILLTPEEWVRQHIVHWLVYEKNVPIINIVLEKQLIFNERKKRFDILVYKAGVEHLLVECKAPEIKLSNDTCRQIAVYNKELNAPYLMISNGLNSILFEWNKDKVDYLQTKNLEF